MTNSILIKQATIVNEGSQYIGDVLIDNGVIALIEPNIDKPADIIINAASKYLLPGIIDTHVHFREPGLTHKGDISSESAAAVAGGVTSYFDMPNSIPNTVTLQNFQYKYAIAQHRSYANYAFYLGATADTISLLNEIPNDELCGVTDDGLYFTNAKSLLVDQLELLEKLLNQSSKIIAIHSEDEDMISFNLDIAQKLYKENIPPFLHPVIRSEEACYRATQLAISTASKTSGRLHVLHLSTGRETLLFQAEADVRKKKVTAEVCIHHLWFNNKDYSTLGNSIKWNPAIKTEKDRQELIKAVNEDRIDIISTDHAPHLYTEKSKPYTNSPSGAPMVQHALPVMFELIARGELSITKVVEKMCHNPAILFGIQKRGFIREGYYADLVLVDPMLNTTISKYNILYKCGWSPLEDQQFSAGIYATIVNGEIAYMNGNISSRPAGHKLTFTAR